MKKNNLKGSMILSTAALIWGLAFTAQSVASKGAPPFMINALRSITATVFLLAVCKIYYRKNNFAVLPKEKEKRRYFIKNGAICGTLLAVAVNFQQFGFVMYPKGVPVEARAGFLTSLYVILVPFLNLVLGKKQPKVIWLSAFIALLGVFLLCFSSSGGGIYYGDILIFLCAVACSLHIIKVDGTVGEIGGLRLSVLQFFFCGIISAVLSVAFEFTGILCEEILWSNVMKVMPQILYLGLISSGVAYTMQIIGQFYAEAGVASLCMSLEGVFAALGGWIIMGNTLTVYECIGGLLVFLAIITAQIPDAIKRRSPS